MEKLQAGQRALRLRPKAKIDLASMSSFVSWTRKANEDVALVRNRFFSSGLDNKFPNVNTQGRSVVVGDTAFVSGKGSSGSSMPAWIVVADRVGKGVEDWSPRSV
jgi:hypothetical protein